MSKSLCCIDNRLAKIVVTSISFEVRIRESNANVTIES